MSPKLPKPAGRAEALVAAVARRPEHVVRLAPLRIGQDLVGLIDLLEALVGAGLAVDVRMRLLGELPEGALDLRVRGVPPDAEDRVEIAFRGHPAEVYRLSIRAPDAVLRGAARPIGLDSTDPEDKADGSPASNCPGRPTTRARPARGIRRH
jgi:hypothetical protein